MAKTKKTETIKIEQTTEQKPKETKRRGRTKGIKLEKNDVILQINDIYRLNLSDGRNKTIEKFLTKTRMNDDEEGRWKSGDKYTEWSDIGCYPTTYKYAFDRLHDMMVEDGIKEKGTVTLKEFYEIYKNKQEYLERLFKNGFTDK